MTRAGDELHPLRLMGLRTRELSLDEISYQRSRVTSPTEGLQQQIDRS